VIGNISAPERMGAGRKGDDSGKPDGIATPSGGLRGEKTRLTAERDDSVRSGAPPAAGGGGNRKARFYRRDGDFEGFGYACIGENESLGQARRSVAELGIKGFMMTVAGTKGRPSIIRIGSAESFEAMFAFLAAADVVERLELDGHTAAAPFAEDPGRKHGRYGEHEIEKQEGRPFPGLHDGSLALTFHAA